MSASILSYVSIRQHTSAYVSIRQHTSAYVSIYTLLLERADVGLNLVSLELQGLVHRCLVINHRLLRVQVPCRRLQLRANSIPVS